MKKYFGARFSQIEEDIEQSDFLLRVFLASEGYFELDQRRRVSKQRNANMSYTIGCAVGAGRERVTAGSGEFG